MAGLICGSRGAIAVPAFFLALSLRTRFEWLDRIAGTAEEYSMLVGLFASFAGIPLASFAWGKIRWFAVPACVLSLALCCWIFASPA
jgi:hypothetical protein